ncbi:FGGY family carbohydrate kinase [Gymnodinialimonas sp. 2305UL16-5]|uniref:xylulokinase n=1 Tax=Gymnodinialimonas mytili TaxID=3126503 RepID=UPI00309E1319
MARTIGIDVGTTSVKAAIIDADGTVLDTFSEGYATLRPRDGHVEQDPRDWMRLVNAALAAFAGHDVTAIGLTSQVNTHVFTDAAGTALAPAILWQDGRAAEEAAGLDAQVSPAQKQDWWGAPMPIDASNVLSRMAWMARHRPEIWDQTRYVMLPKDYCLFHLTGAAISDPLSNIGLVGPDLAHVSGALDMVPGAADRILPLAQPCTQIGAVQSGPFRGTPLICGTMDAWAGLVGTGGARDGTMMYLSGTSEILGISSRKVVPTPGAIVFADCDGVRLHAAPTQAGGDAAAWFAGTQGLTLSDMADQVTAPRSAATPLFLPQLEGERAPLWDADLRGAFLGLSRQTDRTDLARAVYEGVAFSARMALEVLEISADVTGARIRCGGGGFRSVPWAQIRADILGKELHVLAAGEPGTLGAASMAAIGAGIHDSYAEANAALARFDRVYTPDDQAHARYNTLYELYREAIEIHADLGKRLIAANR